MSHTFTAIFNKNDTREAIVNTKKYDAVFCTRDVSGDIIIHSLKTTHWLSFANDIDVSAEVKISVDTSPSP